MVTQEQKSWVYSWRVSTLASHWGFAPTLLDAIAAADLGNQAKIATAFPEIFAAYKWWQSGAFEAERAGK